MDFRERGGGGGGGRGLGGIDILISSQQAIESMEKNSRVGITS